MQTFTGKEYLKIDIASNFGLSKELWDDRIKWFDSKENQLESLVHKAKSPALYHAGVQAWRDTQKGIPTGYMISLDATSSGLQILAALANDRSAALLCNVLNTGRREDAYENVYSEMLNQSVNPANVTNEMVKQAVMTALYGSTAVPKQVFGEGKLLEVFYETMIRVASGAWELNETFLGMWNSDTYSHDWVLPDNFHVRNKVITSVKEVVYIDSEPYDIFYQENIPHAEGRSLGANIVHSLDGMMVREMTRRCSYAPELPSLVRSILAEGDGTKETTENDKMVMILWNHYKMTGYLSARILEHITKDNVGHVHVDVITRLLDSLPEKPFNLISIHDCFRCHPNYGNDMRKQYNLQLHNIAKSYLLSDIVSQLIGRTVQATPLDKSMVPHILDTDYALS